MKLFLLLMSLFWIAVGITLILSPAKFKSFYTRLIKPAKALFILPLVIGLLLIWSSPASKLEWFIKILGIIALIKGIFILISPIDTIKSIINWAMSRPDKFYRLYGVFIILLGIIAGWSVTW
ncbi:MAG: hypothetical protein WC317_07715 [Candidatus Omnitrophota bacterium]|jgi:uncharacterized protein YjeT (DUF2065 family)